MAEAAQISKATGAPIKVVFTREDDTQHGFLSPGPLHKLSGSMPGSAPGVAASDEPGVDRSVLDAARQGQAREQRGRWGREPGYAIPNLGAEYGAREVGRARDVVAVGRALHERLRDRVLDELAAAGKIDPLELRLRLLAEPRKVRVPPDNESTLDTSRLRACVEPAAPKRRLG